MLPTRELAFESNGNRCPSHVDFETTLANAHLNHIRVTGVTHPVKLLLIEFPPGVLHALDIEFNLNVFCILIGKGDSFFLMASIFSR